MKTYTVHVSDPSGFDDSIKVDVNDGNQLGHAVHLALDELVARKRAPLTFPIFVDVHQSNAYSDNSWMFKTASGGAFGNMTN